jgi:hypothetical protein
MSGTYESELPVNRDHHFGACPECGGTDGYINVRKSHWFPCDTHRTRWCVGRGCSRVGMTKTKTSGLATRNGFEATVRLNRWNRS